MLPSGVWRGFWEQEGYGRQPMEAFELHFRGELATGHGRDVVGRFTFHGEFDEKSGRVMLIKQYLGRHQVLYDGRPDGEGSILGKWTITESFVGREYVTVGPFVLSPDLPRPTGDEPIIEIKK
ncbi:MAG TPA: hypothetical protein VM533_08160 [Fimbriiglobus sp.]|nr:hypothetical protein [Fimbriiglobus sp.]